RFSGTFNTYRFTSFTEQVTSNGEVFEPLPISRNKLKVSTQDQTENALEITVPFDIQMVTDYAYQNAPPELVLTLLRAHEQNPNDSVILWEGRVTGFSVEGRIAKLKVPALMSYALNGNAPTPRYQAPCNYVLYDSRCGVDPTLHQHITTVTQVTGNIIRVDSYPWAPNDAVAGQMISPGGEQRMITEVLGTDITVTYPFANLSVGDTITLRKGCDHAFNGDCKNKFANGDRFGGFPIVPDRNPFTSTLT
ncbi:MAG: hypothetical protein CMB99_15425, partial [Flavobacteriaceae bacterium]|nr:hypothetical protein [Flavobacteriaceae bacterium]